MAKDADTSRNSERILIDSSGWIEYFSNGRLCGAFSEYIESANPANTISSPIIIYEVYKKLKTIFGEDMAIEVTAHIQSYTTIIELDQNVALKAADLSLERKISMADSFILATSILTSSKVVTSDEHFKGMEEAIYIN
jgi:predicted nucleic acid-binding protein